MPAALVEVGFINTEQDNELLDLKFPEVAQAIADGILETINAAEMEGAGLEETERRFYTVETGVFMHYNNAKNLAENMQEDGFDCYIETIGDCYRVRHGSFEEMEQAKADEKALFDLGYEARVICLVES